MDHSAVLSRAWTLLWRYRALWLFGFLFALAGGGSSFGGPPGGGSSNRGGPGSSSPGSGVVPPSLPSLPEISWETIGAIVLGVVVVVLLLVVILTILRYVTETALIAGVDEIESTGAALTVRRGFRLGWSRQAWRLFLTEFVIYLIFGLAAVLLLALAASPLLLLLIQADAVRAIAIGAAVLLVLSAILFLIVAALTLSLVMPYIQRRVVLGRQGVVASFRQGLGLVRASLRDTGLMWLLLVAIGIVWAIVKIPMIIVLVVAAVVMGGVPAALVYLASQSWVAAAVVGLPLFLVVLIPTAAFIEGLFQVYHSSVWTLAYREVAGRHGDLLPVNGS
jgi:hypothetical protein